MAQKLVDSTMRKAFNILYGHGLVCRAALPGNRDEALQTLERRVAERKAKGEGCTGTIFFLEQEMKNGQYPLYYGPLSDPHGGRTARIGKLTVDAIRQAGGWCEWDGNPKSAILVKEN